MQRWLVVLFIISIIIKWGYAQSVIVNEISQGTGGGEEWVELLVVTEGTDIRGWELGDYDDSNWHSIAEFTDHLNWADLRAGTIIVIFNSGDVDPNISDAGGEDFDFNDKSVIIPISNTTYVTDTGPWGLTAGAFANSDTDDCPAIRDASDNMVHDMAVTHSSATVTSPGSGKVKYYTGNTTSGIIDNSQWITTSSSAGTPGQPNGGDNSNWVDQSLPVELSQWFAHYQNGSVVLQWTTDSEHENQGFIIERALSQAQDPNAEPMGAWTQISSFLTNTDLSGQGSTCTTHEYLFTDSHVSPNETYIYRLSDVDYNGTITLHEVISVTVPDIRLIQGYSLNTYPNPSNSNIHIVLKHENEFNPVRVDILNLNGEVVNSLFAGNLEYGETNILWDGTDMNEIPVPSGIYIVNSSGSGFSHSRAITILK